MIVPLFLALVLSPSVAVRLKYISTYISPGDKFTFSVQMDDMQIMHYDSDTKELITDTEWMKKIFTNKTHWNTQNKNIQTEQDDLRVLLEKIMDHFKNSAGDHNLTQIHSCQCKNPEDKGCSGFKKFIYNNEEFIKLDLKTTNWIPVTNDAEDFLIKTKWDFTKEEAKTWMKWLETECIDNLNLYMKYRLTRVAVPEVQVFQQISSSSSDLVCHATGFFPRPVNMTWQKDGEKVEENVEIRETLPNQDGSFQKRIILRVSPEDLKKHKYTCVIQHSSLKEDLELKVELKEELRDLAEISGIIIGVVVSLLIGIILVVVGFVIWKKKTDFKHLPDSEKGSRSSEEKQNLSI